MSPGGKVPGPWLVAAAVLGGLAAGVLFARAPAPVEPVPPPPPAAAPGPVAGPTAPAAVPIPSIPGAPPAEIAREMESALVEAFRPGPDEPEVHAARAAAYERLKGLTDRWAAASPRSPLASAGWWRAALGRAQPTGEGERRGLVGGAIQWGGRPFPVLYSVPAGPGPFPAVIGLADGEPRAEAESGWGKLLATHLVVVVPRAGVVYEMPRLAMLALGEAGRRWGVDRDRVVLDGTGDAARAVASLAAEESSRLCGAVVRGPFVPEGPAENLARLPVLAALRGNAPEEAAASMRRACPQGTVLRGAGSAEAQDWIAALPPRPASDPRRPAAWASVTGKGFKGWGPGFLVRGTRGAGAGLPVRVSIERDPARNAVVLRTECVAEILLLLTDEGLDLDRPVLVIANGRVVATQTVERSLDTVRTWVLQEPGLFVAAELPVVLPE